WNRSTRKCRSRTGKRRRSRPSGPIRTSMNCRPTRRRYVLCRRRVPRMSLSSRSSSNSMMSPTAKSDTCGRCHCRRHDNARHQGRLTCLMPGDEEAVAELALLETQQCESRVSSSVLSGCHRRDLTQRRAREQDDTTGCVTDRDFSGVSSADLRIDQSCVLNSTLDPLWELKHRFPPFSFGARWMHQRSPSAEWSRRWRDSHRGRRRTSAAVRCSPAEASPQCGLILDGGGYAKRSETVSVANHLQAELDPSPADSADQTAR